MSDTTETNLDILTAPLSMPLWRNRVATLLQRHGLRLDNDIDYYAVAADADGNVYAGAGVDRRGVVKDVAVDPALHGSGLAQRLLSHLISEAAARGRHELKVYTKPQFSAVFESLGFRTIASCPQAVMLENAVGGLQRVCDDLAALRKPGRNGFIVVNANPLTKGHIRLVNHASEQVDTLYVMVVAEEASMFPFSERLEMVRLGCERFKNVVVLHGNDYAVSAATFPTYFLKTADEATEAHIRLDLDLCARHIMPALGATVRFVGSEPADALTARYNELMHEILPEHGLTVDEMPRYGKPPVSATNVRHALSKGQIIRAYQLTPNSTHPFLLAQLVFDTLTTELNTAPKPGLVSPVDNGAHTDMDYALMRRSIDILRPYFVRMAQMGQLYKNVSRRQLTALGIEAEQQMLAATGGVNTHRGAIFALGLAITAAADLLKHGQPEWQQLSSHIMTLCIRHHAPVNSHGAEATALTGARGALAMAKEGYLELFKNWLPLYRRLLRETPDTAARQTLLAIIATLDDTNVVHRAGPAIAKTIKDEARQLADNFSPEEYAQWCADISQQGISPGGAADMLALTIFCHSIVKSN